MDDRELNEKLARLCGIPTYTWDEAFKAFGDNADRVPPFICGGFLRLESQTHAERWNPVGDWRLVHDFVIPAIERAGGNVFLMFHGKRGRSVAIDRDLPQAPGEDFETELLYDESGLTPRLVCEAALQAWEQLEAAG